MAIGTTNRRWRGGRDWDDHRWRRYNDRHDDNNFGAAAAAGIFGLAAGAIIGGALSQGDSHVRACQARYRSYDPYTDTFLGYDGRRHRCTAF